MLTDPKEIGIISHAVQKNVRDPRRSRKPFERIFQDFLNNVDLDGQVLLDLGPGQFDFGVLAAERGATTYSVDKDPAVVALGRHKGMHTVEGRLEDVGAGMFDLTFDGIFCKYSIDAFWFDDDDRQRAYIEQLLALLKPGGWAWIAPWNGGGRDLPDVQVERILSCQAEGFLGSGFWAVDLSKELSKYYGVHGRTANRALFGLNLEQPTQLSGGAVLRPRHCWTVQDYREQTDTREGRSQPKMLATLKRVIRRLVR